VAKRIQKGRRIRSLIALLVLIPLSGLVFLGFGALGPKLDDVNQARMLERHMQRTSLLIDFSSEIGRAELPWLASSLAGQLGVSPVAAQLLLGFDPQVKALSVNESIRSFLNANASDQFVADTAIQWRTFEKGLRAGTLSAEQIFQGFVEIQNSIQMEWKGEAHAALALTLEGTTDLDRQIELVASSLDLSAVNSKEYAILFSVLVATPDAEQNIRMQIVAAQTERAIVQRRIVDLVGPKSPRYASAKALENSPSASVVRKEIEMFLNGQPFRMEENGPARIAAGVTTGLAHINELDDFVRASVRDTITSSRELSRATQSKSRDVATLFAGIFLMSLAVAAYVSAAVTRPLRALAKQARIVADGNLSVDQSVVRGPREITTVSEVVDDLADHLQRVQRQARALATGSFDDDVLAEQVPGPLGTNLTASVSRLLRSIQEREDLQEQLTQQATHDSLTGLPNRAAAMMAVEQAMARATRRNETMAVMFVDLDDFKRANDQGGHAVGDEALRIAGARIKSAVRNGDVVARLGGDEFLVVAESIESVDGIREIADRIVEQIAIPMDIDGAVVRIGASVGFAIPNNATDTAGELLQRADLAMYRAKQNGRGRVVEFDTDLRRATTERRALETAMSDALNDDALRLHFQPVLDGETGELKSVEALLRWDRPGFGPQSPARFIPILEATPLIIDVGRWVLIRATELVQAQRQVPGFEHLAVAVNLSGRHLMHATLLDDVRLALDASGLPPEALIIEITETALVTDLATVVEQTRALHSLGVKIAIDDFGTGYTSIGQLTRLPVDILKIDRSFVDQIGVPSSRRIVELIIEVGHTLDMCVTAEGVEDIQQLHALAALNCDFVQGFFLGTPLPLSALGTPDPLLDRYFAERSAFDAAVSK
jgi:diguanylate cyclase (GGDEF)-like protein